jgi:16S rRNA (uracil1498-N3)-methyltransferase
MADRFYTPDSLSLGDYVLEGPEAHHLASVRRFGPGDCVTLFNGDGLEYPAEVISVAKKSVVLHISRAVSESRELSFPLFVASALPKGDRADFLIEKMTELGVTRFIPLIAERSVVRPKPSTIEKFQRAVIESSKQCGRNVLMAVDRPCDWPTLLQRSDLPTSRYLLDTNSSSGKINQSTAGATVAVGPEGGFTPEEVDAGRRHGWEVVGLGSRILRIETAALAAAAVFGIR